VATKKKKNPVLLYVFTIMMFMLVAAAYYYNSRPRFVRYAAFGIELPSKYTIHGIDVSHYQRDIDWDDVKAMEIKNVKIGFSFIKATEGLSDVDGRFKSNWKEAQVSGISRGAYHFFIPTKSGKTQAQNFIANVHLSKGDLPPVLDIEQLNGISKETLQQRVSEWLLLVENHYKVKPIIYTGADFYNNFLSGAFDNYPLWVAHYFAREKPRVVRNWQFWQHNEAGHVNGIDSYVDFNVFNGDSTDFKNILIQ
jgi:lysozyme